MKFLVNIEPNNNVIPPAQAVALIEGMKTEVQAQVNSGAIESVYNIAPGTGFVVYDVGNLETVWDLLPKFPLFPYWKVEVRALLDTMHVLQSYLDRIDAAKRVLAPV